MNRRRLLLLAAILAAPACGLVNTENPATAPTPTNVVNYSAIGASDAIGIGASVYCLPFVDCPNGTGYVQLIAKRLKTDGKKVTLLNLGLPGGVLSPEIQSIGNSLNRDVLTNFLDNEAPFVSQDSTLVTIFAGGNDVNIVGAALEAGYAGTDIAGYVQTRAENFGRDLRKLLTTIKERAPTSRVVILNLPNMAALPYAGGYSLQQRRVFQDVAVKFSAQINSLTSQGAIVVDIMCDPSFYQPGFYSSDGFHPNDAGYARMAEVTYLPASTGSGSAPRAACAQMTLF